MEEKGSLFPEMGVGESGEVRSERERDTGMGIGLEIARFQLEVCFFDRKICYPPSGKDGTEVWIWVPPLLG